LCRRFAAAPCCLPQPYLAEEISTREQVVQATLTSRRALEAVRELLHGEQNTWCCEEGGNACCS
jgi:hypothetical protein